MLVQQLKKEFNNENIYIMVQWRQNSINIYVGSKFEENNWTIKQIYQWLKTESSN